MSTDSINMIRIDQPEKIEVNIKDLLIKVFVILSILGVLIYWFGSPIYISIRQHKLFFSGREDLRFLLIWGGVTIVIVLMISIAIRKFVLQWKYFLNKDQKTPLNSLPKTTDQEKRTAWLQENIKELIKIVIQSPGQYQVNNLGLILEKEEEGWLSAYNDLCRVYSEEDKLRGELNNSIGGGNWVDIFEEKFERFETGIENRVINRNIALYILKNAPNNLLLKDIEK